MKTRTLKKWNKKGYLVIRGSKAVGFNDKGKALFSEEQVEEMPVRCRLSYHQESTSQKVDRYYFGGDNPDQMDYDLGLCGQD